MTTKRERLVKNLTRRFALQCGLPLPHPKAPAGELHKGYNVFRWYKCAKHGTWMQPCFCNKVPHWHCAKEECDCVKVAKFRSELERELFRIMKYLMVHGE